MPLPDPSSLPRPWLTSYPPGVPPTYAYPDVPLTRFLDDAARDFPDTVATWFEGATIGYADLLDRVDRFATALGELGVERGDRVAVLLPNTPAVVVALFAALRLGAVVVPCDPSADDATLLEQLRGSGAEIAVCDASAVGRINAFHARLRHLRYLVTTSPHDWLPFPRNGMVRLRRALRRSAGADDAVRPMAALIAGSDPIAKQEPLDPEDPAVLQYVGSGSSARAVVLSHGNLTANAFQARLWVPDAQAGRERVLVALPVSVPYGLAVALLAGVLSAATLVLVDDDPGHVLDVATATQPTMIPGSPELFERLVGHRSVRKRDLRALRLATCAGPVRSETAERFESITGARLREAYTLAEAASLTHANPMYGRNVAGSIGLPVTDTVSVVLDDDGSPCAPGQVGTLAVNGPQVATRYWGAAPAVAPTFADGWVLTGDRAVVDDDGYFRLVG